MPSDYDLSLVVPVYNEEEMIPLLWQELAATLPRLAGAWQVVFVDDGSQDSSSEQLRAIALANPNVVYVRFKRNQGQATAYRAGFRNASGRLVATLDADLQIHPRELEKFLPVQAEGDFDVVYGRRESRRGSWLKRVLTSRTANWMIRTGSGSSGHDAGCGLKVYKLWLARELLFFSGLHRMSTALSKGFGAREAEVSLLEGERLAGTSKYGLKRIFQVIPDLARALLMTRLVKLPFARCSSRLKKVSLIALLESFLVRGCLRYELRLLAAVLGSAGAFAGRLEEWRATLLEIRTHLLDAPGYPLDEELSIRAR